jgi:hypothetical protein
MEFRDGVWVVDAACVGPIAAALRSCLLAVGQARAVDANRAEARDVLHEYLSGREFPQRIAAIADAVSAMELQLQSEKRSFARIWAQREKQIEQIACTTAGMYGDLQGILGGALQTVELLELPPAA